MSTFGGIKLFRAKFRNRDSTLSFVFLMLLALYTYRSESQISFVQSCVDGICNMASTAASTVSNAASAGVQSLSNSATTAYNCVGSACTYTGNAIGDVWNGNFSSAASNAGKAAASGYDAASSVVTAPARACTSAGCAAYNTVQGTENPVANGVKTGEEVLPAAPLTGQDARNQSDGVAFDETPGGDGKDPSLYGTDNTGNPTGASTTKGADGCYSTSCSQFLTLAKEAEVKLKNLPTKATGTTGVAANSYTQSDYQSTNLLAQVNSGFHKSDIPTIQAMQDDLGKQGNQALQNLQAELPKYGQLASQVQQNDTNAIKSKFEAFKGQATLAMNEAAGAGGAAETLANHTKQITSPAAGGGGSTPTTSTGGTNTPVSSTSAGSGIPSTASTPTKSGSFWDSTLGKVVLVGAGAGLGAVAVNALSDDDESSNNSSSDKCSNGTGTKNNCTKCNNGYELNNKKCVKIEAE